MMQRGDRVRAIVKPWEGKQGTIVRVDGAYVWIRLDDSEDPKDIIELYPCEFELEGVGS